MVFFQLLLQVFNLFYVINRNKNQYAFVIRIKLLFSSNYYYYRLSQLRLFLPVFLTPVEKGFSGIYSSIKLVYTMPEHQAKVYKHESDCQVILHARVLKYLTIGQYAIQLLMAYISIFYNQFKIYIHGT